MLKLTIFQLQRGQLPSKNAFTCNNTQNQSKNPKKMIISILYKIGLFEESSNNFNKRMRNYHKKS